MRRRWWLGVALLGAVLAGLYVVARSGREQGTLASARGAAADETPATNDPTAARGATPATLPPAPITSALHDRATRDDVRRRILEAWMHSPDPETAAAARDGRFTPMPTDNDAGARYIQSVVREEFFPLAKQCYEELLTRKDAGGRLEMSFAIVGDEKIGGVVDDVQIAVDGGIDDPEMLTCMRESFLAVSFRPPPHGATKTTVVYPIELSP